MAGPARPIKPGDRIRVVGEFTVETVEEHSFGTVYTHKDEDGQDWAFTPGGNTVSMEILEENQ